MTPMDKSYRINEIFYSLQGEGTYTGVAMIFVRFSGCNLRCPFCDTRHETYEEMTAAQIREAISQYPCQRVCLTGGEPTMQVTDELIREAFADYKVHMETNGTHSIPSLVDWATVSPKKGKVVVEKCQELKLLFGEGMDNPEEWMHIACEQRCLQPVDIAGDPEATRRNTQAAIEYIQQHPQWRLSLQTHKMTGIR